jgi:ubiquinone/menaquinone biosynthesis C-methylase UbiE
MHTNTPAADEQIKIRDQQADIYVDMYLKRGPTFISLDRQIMLNWPEFKSTDVLLDAGAGVGYFTTQIAPLVKSIAAIDFSRSSIEILQNNLKKSSISNVVASQADLRQKLSFQDNTFDKAISYQVLSYVEPEYYHVTFRELHRVLKPGASLYFSVLRYGPRGEFRKVKEDFANGVRRFAFSREDLVKIQKMAGFSSIETRGFLNAGARARKLSDQYKFFRTAFLALEKFLTNSAISNYLGQYYLVKMTK